MSNTNDERCDEQVPATSVRGCERLPGIILVCSEPPNHDGDHRDFATNVAWPRAAASETP